MSELRIVNFVLNKKINKKTNKYNVILNNPKPKLIRFFVKFFMDDCSIFCKSIFAKNEEAVLDYIKENLMIEVTNVESFGERTFFIKNYDIESIEITERE